MIHRFELLYTFKVDYLRRINLSRGWKTSSGRFDPVNLYLRGGASLVSNPRPFGNWKQTLHIRLYSVHTMKKQALYIMYSNDNVPSLQYTLRPELTRLKILPSLSYLKLMFVNIYCVRCVITWIFFFLPSYVTTFRETIIMGFSNVPNRYDK